MKNLEIIRELRASTFTDEDGEEYQLEFQNALTDAEIDKLRPAFPNQVIAPELVEILQVTRGWDGYGPEAVYFDSIGEFGFTELSPHSVTLGHDGFGNFWILDIDSKGNLGKVFYACHDPAVLVIHSQNLNEYLGHLLEFYRKPDAGHMTEIHEDTVFNIWREDTASSQKPAFQAANPSFADFLNQFEGDEWTVADLRTGQNKEGFAWGKLGPNQYTQRHPQELLWVIKNRKKGFFAKLFGG